MGINISGVSLNDSNSSLTVTNNAKTVSFKNDGKILAPNTPMFYAGATSTVIDATMIPGAIWNKMTFSNVVNNVGGCFASNRFTAPITGTYYFSANCYANWPTADSDYCHPLFYVNGSPGTRRGGTTGYRIRHHGCRAGLSGDNQITEIYSLIAGDYVEFYIYTSGTTVLVNYYKGFAGVFLG